jgi:hypothetical protein
MIPDAFCLLNPKEMLWNATKGRIRKFYAFSLTPPEDEYDRALDFVRGIQKTLGITLSLSIFRSFYPFDKPSGYSNLRQPLIRLQILGFVRDVWVWTSPPAMPDASIPTLGTILRL